MSNWAETIKLGAVDTEIAYNQGGGSSQAIGAIVYSGNISITVDQMSTYVFQVGTEGGSFQMAILQPTSTTSATVIGVTSVATSLTGGLFTLPLTASVVLVDTQFYYFAVFNQISSSVIGGESAGFGTIQDAPPINFRIQNITGFTLGDTIDISDVSLRLSPWIAAHD